MDSPDSSGQSALSTSADTIRNFSFPPLLDPAHIRAEHNANHSNTNTHSRGTSPSRAGSPFSYFSHPSSPHSSWPSPSSPSGESVSSLPSVSSSFLFSSVPASPPHHHDTQRSRNREGTLTGHHAFGEADSSLIIPSLTLPSALRAPTAYGQTLGRVRLLVLGHCDTASVKVTDDLVSLLSDEEYDEVVHVGSWEDQRLENDKGVNAKVLRVSTDWVEYRDENGDERYEPSRNVEIVRMDDYSSDDSAAALEAALSLLHAPFRAQSHVRSAMATMSPLSRRGELHLSNTGAMSPTSDLTSPLMLPLVRELFHSKPATSDNASTSPQSLYTALVFIPASPLTPADEHLMCELGKHVPLIVLHPPPRSPQQQQQSPTVDDTPRPPPEVPTQAGLTRPSTSHLSTVTSAPVKEAIREQPSLSSVRPATPIALRISVYRSPHAIATLRREATELFLKSTLQDSPVESTIAESSTIVGSTEDTRAFSAEKARRWMNQTREEPDLSTSETDAVHQLKLDGTIRAREGPLATRRPSHTRARGAQRPTRGGRGRGAERRKSVHARPPLLTQPPPASVSPSASTVGASSTGAAVLHRRNRSTQQDASASPVSAYAHPSTFDPLHIPSLVRLAVEGLILGPLRVRLARIFVRPSAVSQGKEREQGSEGVAAQVDTRRLAVEQMNPRQEAEQVKRRQSLVPIVLVAGAFCAGVGVGILLARSHANL